MKIQRGRQTKEESWNKVGGQWGMDGCGVWGREVGEFTREEILAEAGGGGSIYRF